MGTKLKKTLSWEIDNLSDKNPLVWLGNIETNKNKCRYLIGCLEVMFSYSPYLLVACSVSYVSLLF